MDSLQGGKLRKPFRGPWAGTQTSVATALGLAGHDRFAARLLLVLEVRGACGVGFHEVKVTLTKGHGSRPLDQRPQET